MEVSNSSYYWVSNKVLTDAEMAGIRHEGRLVVDTYYPTNEPNLRYGKYVIGSGWVHMPLSSFPKGFRSQLLLLGVP